MFNSCSHTTVPPSVTAPLPSHSTNVPFFSAGGCKQLSESRRRPTQRLGVQVTAAGGNLLPRGFQTTLTRALLNYTNSLRLKLCLDKQRKQTTLTQTSHRPDKQPPVDASVQISSSLFSSPPSARTNDRWCRRSRPK